MLHSRSGAQLQVKAMVDQKIINSYDEFVHGGMECREFLERLSKLAGGAAAAMAALPLLENNYALAQIVPEADSRLVTSKAEYEAVGGKVSGYLARLKGGGKRPGVIVIHENRSLNPHMQNVARQAAVEGFLAAGAAAW